MTAYTPHFRPIQALLVGALALFAADPMPYDSIGNPLNNLLPTDKTIQWQGDSLNLVPNRVRVNQAGYRQRDVAAGYAKFYYLGTGTAFDVVNMAGAKVASGALVSKGVNVSGQIIADATKSAEHQNNGVGDWKAGYPKTGTVVSGALKQGALPATLPVGKYTIKVGSDTSVPFIVSDNVYSMARDAALKFFGVARSGDYESWFHPASHMWDGWLYDSAAKNTDGSYKYKGALKGGWYDCGNHLKEARTNSYPLATLGMLAATMQEKDADRYALNQNATMSTDRIPDVLREAWVGSQFVFNSWRLAKGVPDSMYLSVGDLSYDFAWWGRPENQDAVISRTRGGRTERYLVRDWGGPSMADFAAGMAFLSRLYRPYGSSYADSALRMARAMYENAKTTKRKESSRDYTGDQAAFDDLGLAAVALLWATGETKYLKDAVITPAMPDGLGGTCKSADYSVNYALSRFEGGYFGCGTNGMQYGGPTDYGSVNRLALYSFAKLILVNADTASRYGISSGMRDTLLLRTITQIPSTVWGSSPGTPIQIPTGDQYNPVRLTYDSIWYSMGIGYGKSGWWNKYQFGNLADLYMFYDVTSIVDGRTILNKPGNTDWKRKEVLQVLLGGLNYMFGTNALDLSYLYGIGRKNPMHPHHRGANPEGKNTPGAYYNYTIPIGGLYGGLETGPANTEKMEELWSSYRQTEANCPDAQAAVMIPLMGLASEVPFAAPKTTVKVLYTTDSMAVIQVDIDKWGTVKFGYGLDSSIALQTTVINGGDTGGTFKIKVPGLKPGTQYFFNVVAKDLQGLTSTTSKWPNGASDSVPFNFITKSQPPLPPQYASIKVCNVTSDSAEIMWYTPNGEYLSSVKWADSANWKGAKYSVVDTDMVGDIPVKFHHVKLYNLKAKTTYNFQVGVPGAYEPTVGCFRTPGEDVKFEIKTTHYMWDGHPAVGIGVVNQDVKSYDSLQIRLYVNGTRANIVDLAARVDIAFAYRTDGSTDSGLFQYTKGVQSSRPKLIDPTCPAATQSCAWYFDLPMYGAVMASQSRWRLDVLFDKHNLIRDSTELLNTAPTHDPFSGTDWSFRPHVAGSDNGLSPVDFVGVPAASKNAIDSISMDIPTNPYIAVYRRNEFVYGFSPFAAEQATKRTVFTMTSAWESPFDISPGGTIALGTGASSRLKGTLDAYDVMLPASKGWITSVWVNGVALSEAERKAALTRQADGTWKVDLPLRFATGTNKLDVTFFAGSDSVDDVPTGTCQEGKGCAFVNVNWYVNYVSNMTPSTITVVDGSDKSLGLVVPDSSSLRIRVKDGNANASKTAIDNVKVKVSNLRTGAVVDLTLPETGVNTGVFQTDLLKVVSASAAAGQLQLVPGDTLLAKYVDASDASDSVSVRIWSRALWPSLVSGAVAADCGQNLILAKLDRPLGSSGPVGPEILANADFENPQATYLTQYYYYTGLLGGWNVSHVDVVPSSVQEIIAAAQGQQSLDMNDTMPGSIRQTVSTIPGGSVLLSFKYSVNNAPNTYGPQPDIKLAQIRWDKTIVDTLRWDTRATPTATWIQASYVLPSTGSDSIVFQSLNLGNKGIMLDDISIKRLGTVAGSGDSILGGTVVLTDVSGDTVSKQNLSNSDIVSGGAGTDLRIVSSARDLHGVTGGILTLNIKTKAGRTITTSVSIQDAIGPWIDSAKIVENLSGSPVDTMYVWTSEAVKPLGKTLPVIVRRSGAVVSTSGLAVDDAVLVDASTGKWIYTIRGGVIKARDSLRWDPSKVADVSGNAALDCPSLLREVKLVSRPAPFARAWIADSDGDGRADQVTMVFRKVLVASDLPDSIQAVFGAGNAGRTVAIRFAMATDSVLRIPLPSHFPLADTRGSGANGSGSLSLWKSGERTGPFELVDSVGPALLSAKLRFGNSNGPDTLDLDFSEPVRRSTGTGWLLQQPTLELGTLGDPDSVSSTHWKLSVEPSAVLPGDSVRPIPTGKWADQSTGRKVASKHPWVVVVGGERAPIGGWFLDVDGDGAVDRATVNFSKAPRTRPAMLLLWPSKSGFDTTKIDSGSWDMNADGRTATLSVGPFAKGVTSISNNRLGRWVSAGATEEFPMEDSVPAVIVSAAVRYASRDGVPDTLKVRWSEPISWKSGPLVFRKNLGKGVDPKDVPYLQVLQDADGLGASLLLDSGTILMRGDLARLAPPVSDLPGNVASDPTVWVPVTFGVRPPRLESQLHPMVDYDKSWELGTGTPFRTWMRGRGDTKWLLGNGSEPEDTTNTHFMGITLTLNQVLEGSAHIFDNAGTFVIATNFDGVRKAADAGVFTPDEAGMYQVRLAWDGRTLTGKPAASGVYYMRLVLKYKVEGKEMPFIVNRVYTLGFKRAVK